MGSFNYIWTVGPTLVNELLISASADRAESGIASYSPFQRSKYGINFPYIFPDTKLVYDKIPTVAIANFATMDGSAYPSHSAGPIFVVSDNTTKVVRSHTIKWGVNFEHSGENDFDQINAQGVPGGTNNQNGRFVFTDTRGGAPSTGLAIGNTAMGIFDTYAEVGQKDYTLYRANMIEGFVQDSWKATPKLRVEIGLRYTYMTLYYYSLWGNMAVFDPNRYDPAKAVVQNLSTGYIISGDRYNGVVIPGTGWPDAAKGRIAIASDSSYNRLFSGGPNYWGKRQ
jgi:hypothetical protein